MSKIFINFDGKVRSGSGSFTFEYSNPGDNISILDRVGSGREREVSRERGGAERRKCLTDSGIVTVNLLCPYLGR